MPPSQPPSSAPQSVTAEQMSKLRADIDIVQGEIVIQGFHVSDIRVAVFLPNSLLCVA